MNKKILIDLPTPKGTSAALDLYHGSITASFTDIDSSSSPLGINISHILQGGNVNHGYGNGYRLNLDETFLDHDTFVKKLASTEVDLYKNFAYVHTDATGIKNCFREYFYYISEGTQVYVDRNSVSVGSNGELTYTLGHKTHSITREVRSADGWEAVTKLNSVKKIKLFEQRSEERKQLEEQKINYEQALGEYAIFSTESGEKIHNLPLTYSSYENCIPAQNSDGDFTELLITESDSINYRSLKLTLLSNLSDDKKQLYQDQIALIQARSEKNVEYYKSILLEYLRIQEQLSNLDEFEAISYLVKDSTTKGFNAKGQLCAILNGNSMLAIERDSNNRVLRIYNETEDVIKFNYDNGFLQNITDMYGNTVSYTYNSSNWLSAATFSSGKILNFNYGTLGNILSIASSADSVATNASDFKTALFSFSNSKASNAYLKTLKKKIEHANATEYSTISNAPSIVSHQIIYHTQSATPTGAEIIDQDGNRSIYCVDAYGNLTEYYREENNVVTEAEKHNYEYEASETITCYSIPEKVTIQYASEDSLFTTPYSTYNFVSNRETERILNHFNQVEIEKSTEEKSNGSYLYSYQDTVTNVYDSTHRLVRTVFEESIEKKRIGSSPDVDPTVITTETKYFYNAANKLIRTERCIKGHEKTQGVTIEETVYDSEGNVVKTFSYNSFDPSSKFYTESEKDEHGRTIASLDESGKYKTAYCYFGNKTLVQSETFPNGGNLSYSYDAEGNVNAITQSTKDGVANTNTTLYTAGEVTKLVSGNNTVNYSYEDKRRLASVKLNGQNHVNYTYADNVTESGKKVDKITTSYANGYTVTNTYDKWGNLLKTAEGDTITDTATYTSDGKVSSKTDVINNAEHTYSYDSFNRLTRHTLTDNAEGNPRQYNVQDAMTYDDKGYRTSLRTTATGDADVSYYYSYSSVDKKIDYIFATYKYDDTTYTITPKYDAQKRNVGKSIKYNSAQVLEENISYIKHGDHATSMPESIRYAYGSNYGWKDKVSYRYDCMGNISAIYEDNMLVCRYEYDSLNRLVREDNKPFDKTTLYAYDTNGNILFRKEFAFTTKSAQELEEIVPLCVKHYTYDGDKLMSFDGEACVYDALGNPTTYRGKTAVWEKGRRLKRFDATDFSYDSFGRRTLAQSSHFDYDIDGRILFDEGNGFVFVYDQTGVCGFKFLGSFSHYVYQKDIQGNIRAILDTNGNLVVQYKYDAWGKCKVFDENGNEINDDYHIGKLNPFRYRGYYFDTQTGLYYLQSRYYDPETGRFLNADTVEYLDPETINGLNLYAYCGNNPIMHVDPSGHSISIFLIGLLALATMTSVLGGINGAKAATEQNLSGVDYVAEIVHGAFKGFISGLAIGGSVLLFIAGIGAIGGYATILGATPSSVWALGALGLNSISVFGILFGVKTEPVEYYPIVPEVPSSNHPFNHPSMK